MMQRRIHFDFADVAFCQLDWAESRRTRNPLLHTDKENQWMEDPEAAVNCEKCLHKLGKQESV